MPKVYDSLVDNETRCIHCHTFLDIVAIRFKCCEKHYPCYQCHNEYESHNIQRWPAEEFHKKAIFCGVCQNELSIHEYIMTETYPSCQARFNSCCRSHYHLYFETQYLI